MKFRDIYELVKLIANNFEHTFRDDSYSKSCQGFLYDFLISQPLHQTRNCVIVIQNILCTLSIFI